MSINNNETQTNPDPSLQQEAETRLKAQGIYDAAIYKAWQAERNEWIHSEVSDVLDRVSPVVNREGRIQWRHCPNPAHKDEQPSFYIAYDVYSALGNPQCSCGIQHEMHPWDLVAGWVGAQPFMEWWKDISIGYMEISLIRQRVPKLSTRDENHTP